MKNFAKRLISSAQRELNPTFLKNRGYCPCCSTQTTFRSAHSWLRDHYQCDQCHSIPRERALMWTIEKFFPDWSKGIIHESSPGNRGTSVRLARECPNYIGSQFYPGEPLGVVINGMRCENLETLTFKDESIDLHVTQDVFEHVFDPEAAFREIARTLRPGGAHIFTVPLIEKERATQRCAAMKNGEVVHFREPEYHGNPVSAEGSLVTMRWGYDICEFIAKATGLFSQMVYIDALDLGIRAEFIEVLVTRKPAEQSVA